MSGMSQKRPVSVEKVWSTPGASRSAPPAKMAVVAPKTHTSIAARETRERREMAADWKAAARMAKITAAVIPTSSPKRS